MKTKPCHLEVIIFGPRDYFREKHVSSIPTARFFFPLFFLLPFFFYPKSTEIVEGGRVGVATLSGVVISTCVCVCVCVCARRRSEQCSVYSRDALTAIDRISIHPFSRLTKPGPKTNRKSRLTFNRRFFFPYFFFLCFSSCSTFFACNDDDDDDCWPVLATVEIVAVLLLSVIPWPGPSVFKISCPRDRASVVRKIVQKRWLPILKKYQVELPLECPFHESRDIFHPQQAAKIQHRTSQWTCGLCGKSFYAEKHLDAHFDSRHRSNINMAEDAVCLANYCDIMRCDVLGGGELDGSLTDDPSGSLNTDIQIWRESSGGRGELRSGKDNRPGKYGGAAGSSSCECREVARIHKSSQTTQQQTTATTATTTTTTSPVDDKSETAASGSMTSYGGKNQRHCKRGSERGELGSSKGDSAISGSLGSASSHSSSSSSSASSSSPSSRSTYNGPDNESRACDKPKNDDDEVNDEEDDDDDDDDEDDATNLVESSSLPAAASDKRERGKEFEIRKLKSNCKPEELEKLKLQCQILVRDCIAGLLANLSVKDFQEIEGELNRAICWYLSCDKYWEDSRRQPRHTPWYLLIAFLLVLSTGISACYYIISIILGSGDEVGIDSNEENQDSCDGHPSSERALLHDPGGFGGDPMMRHDDHRRRIEIGEERLQVAATGDMPDHYIYVAYPPELKRRLLESCYNRTTRL